MLQLLRPLVAAQVRRPSHPRQPLQRRQVAVRGALRLVRRLRGRAAAEALGGSLGLRLRLRLRLHLQFRLGRGCRAGGGRQLGWRRHVVHQRVQRCGAGLQLLVGLLLRVPSARQLRLGRLLVCLQLRGRHRRGALVRHWRQCRHHATSHALRPRHARRLQIVQRHVRLLWLTRHTRQRVQHLLVIGGRLRRRLGNLGQLLDRQTQPSRASRARCLGDARR
mmetsp:Transcript_27153/g.87288  ORF Transcript_27153/g.87288 Transcript_27153/m.87288 type:complete len:221 (+) Transcript_27153:797-1459(+)